MPAKCSKQPSGGNVPETDRAVFTAASQALSIGLTAFDVKAWPDRIQTVTAEQVRKAASDAFVRKEAVSATLTPATK